MNRISTIPCGSKLPNGRTNTTRFSRTSSGALPPEVVADIGARMQQLKAEIEALRDSKPEKDYTAENITAWLESLRQSPDEKAIRLLIEKITVKNRTDVSIQSTLTSILGNLGCGTRIRT